MADKFRVTFPIQVQFARGEQPTEAKLNSIASQARNGLAMVEKAIGDVWNQSGDGTMSDLPLQIPNLARTLGQQYLANAQFPKPDVDNGGLIVISQDTTGQIGSTILHLDFTPEVGLGSILDDEISAALGLTYTSPLTAFTGNGDYYPEASTGRVYLSDPWTEATIQYEVLAEEFPGVASNTSPYNVIPHPEMEGTWKGIKFVYVSANKYLAFLPPRRPLLSNASEIGKIPRATTNSVDPNNNVGYRYWYSTAGDWDSPVDIAADANHLAIAAEKAYRHRLPDYLYDIVTTGSLGQQLPTGSIYLWDNAQQTIVEGITFKVPEIDSAYGGGLRPGWVLQVEGSILDSLLGGVAGTSSIDTDDPSDYSAENYSVIAVGESVAGRLSSLSDLAITDDNSTDVAQRIPHENLIYVQPKVRSGSDTYTNIPPSYRKGDDHNYLLSREGSTSTAASQRDRYNNGMNGDLLVLSTSGSNKQNLSASSNSVRFGSMTGPSIRHRYNSTSIALRNRSSSAVTGNNWLVLENSPVFLGRGVLAFGTSTTADSGADGSFPGTSISGIDCDTTVSNQGSGGSVGAWFRLFGDNLVNRSGLSVGELAVIGHTYDVTAGQSASNDAHRYGAGTDFIKIQSLVGDNRISFIGGPLDLSDYSASDDVTIGAWNSGTNLRLSNNILEFGTAGAAPRLNLTSAPYNTLDFQTSGGASSGSTFRAGNLVSVDGLVGFSSNAIDRINFATSTFSFIATSLASSIVNAGTFYAEDHVRINNALVSLGTGNRWIRNSGGTSIGAYSSNAIGLYRSMSANAYADLYCRAIQAETAISAGTTLAANGNITSWSGSISASTTITAGGIITGEAIQPTRTNITPTTDAHLYEYTRRKSLVCSGRFTNNAAAADPSILTGSFNILDVEVAFGVGYTYWIVTFDHAIPNLERAIISATIEMETQIPLAVTLPLGTYLPLVIPSFRQLAGVNADKQIFLSLYLQRTTGIGDLIIPMAPVDADQYSVNLTIHGYH